MTVKKKKVIPKPQLNFNLAGILLFWAGFLILIFTFLPVVIQEVRYDLYRPTTDFKIASTPEQAKQLKEEPKLTDTIITPVNFDFSLVIPKIGVNSTVFANIDSGDPAVYLPVLKKGVAHAKGSALPNQRGPVFIFAHSTDTFYNIGQYNAIFFLLGKLKVGDSAYIFHQNRQYSYLVTGKQVVDSEAIPDLVRSTPGNTLILQTCYPPGTTIKRLLVYAKLTQ